MGIALQDLGVGNAQGTYMRDDKGFFFLVASVFVCVCDPARLCEAFALLRPVRAELVVSAETGVGGVR